jgi:hypothetical protein
LHRLLLENHSSFRTKSLQNENPVDIYYEKTIKIFTTAISMQVQENRSFRSYIKGSVSYAINVFRYCRKARDNITVQPLLLIQTSKILPLQQ